MITRYSPGFIRDLKALKKTPVYNTIKQIAFEEIPACSGIDQISNLKKLKGYDQAYRIRVGDYRIGLLIDGDSIIFARVQHRREIYRSFPSQTVVSQSPEPLAQLQAG